MYSDTTHIFQIDLLAACQPQAEILMSEMKEKVKDDERKAWEFELQQYADAKAREQRNFEFRVRQYKDRQAKEKRAEAREQRNFEFEREKYGMEHEKDMAIISASREVALEVARQLPNIK